MRETSALYKTLRAAVGSHYEAQVVRGSTSYGMRAIKSLKVHANALSTDTGPSIGGTFSAICYLTVAESSANWPRMASFEVKVRLWNEAETQSSEWLSFGTFYTDQRTKVKNGDLRITAYDGMLTLKQYWTDKIPEEDMPASWPITAYAAAELLQETTGVLLDSGTTLDNTVAFVGLDTCATARDVWSDIAAAHGGNVNLTPEGKVRIVPLVNGDPDDTTIPDLGLLPRKFENSPALAGISGVELTDDAGHIAAAGNDTGYTLKGPCSFSNSAAAQLCLTNTQGYQYRPFGATSVDLDPAIEPGDPVKIDGEIYQIMSIDWDIGTWIYADLSAPVEYEVDHEYTVMPEQAVTLRRALNADGVLETALRSYIQQTATAIMQGVAAQYVSDNDLQSVVTQLQAQIDGAIETFTGSAVPTLQNYPASSWTTTEEKAKHIGDLYIVNSSGGDYAGFYYRFELNGSTYSWVLLKDSEITKALADAEEANEAAAEAKSTADTLEQLLLDEYSPTAVIDALFETKDEATASAAALQSEISLTTNTLTVAMTELEGSVDSQLSALSYYIRYENGVVIIGRTDSPTSIRISNTQVGIYYGNDAISYWNSSKQLAPKQLEIPVGGSLRLGDIIWQPRSSGNLSMMWVGTVSA